jgi:hypothetical protein
MALKSLKVSGKYEVGTSEGSSIAFYRDARTLLNPECPRFSYGRKNGFIGQIASKVEAARLSGANIFTGEVVFTSGRCSFSQRRRFVVIKTRGLGSVLTFEKRTMKLAYCTRNTT